MVNTASSMAASTSISLFESLFICMKLWLIIMDTKVKEKQEEGLTKQQKRLTERFMSVVFAFKLAGRHARDGFEVAEEGTFG